jgi:cytochrome c-type biogenesis protein CcmH
MDEIGSQTICGGYLPMKRPIWGFLVLAIISSFILVKSVKAQMPTPSDDQVNALAKEMYCPVCENTPLDVCPTTACAQWRELIREKLNQGWTDQQIKAFFADQYGDRVLAEPPITGSNRMIYFLPPIFLLAAAIVVYRVLASNRKKKDKTLDDDAILASQDPYLDKVEEELEHYR